MITAAVSTSETTENKNNHNILQPDTQEIWLNRVRVAIEYDDAPLVHRYLTSRFEYYVVEHFDLLSFAIEREAPRVRHCTRPHGRKRSSRLV